MNKHQNIEENILYIAKKLYELLDKAMYVDELRLIYMERYKDNQVNQTEDFFYYSLLFLFSLGTIEYCDKKLNRRNKNVS